MPRRKSKKGSLHVTVDEELVEWLEEQVDSKRFRSRSHGVEVALELLKKRIGSGEPLSFDF